MRFHFGVSFRWKSIKKFLLPFLIGVLSFFGLSKFQILQVYADSNFDTTFTFDLPQTDVFDENVTSDKTYKEFVDSLISGDSEYYYYFILSNPTTANSMQIWLIPKNDTIRKFNFYFYDGSLRLFGFRNTTYKWFSFGVTNNSFNDRYGVDIFQDCYYDNTCPTYYIPESDNHAFQYSFYNINSNNPLPLFTCANCNNFVNNQSYDLNNYNIAYTSGSRIVFKTSYPMLVDTTLTRSGTSGSSYLYKSVIMNNITLNDDVNIPSYYDLYYSSEPDESLSLPYYLDELGTFFIGSIPKANLGSLTSTISFNFTGLENIDSIRYNILYFGRINHSDNYFSYEKINCNPLNIVSSAIGEDHVITTFFPNGLTCSSDLTNYDNIYIQIQPYNYNSTDKSIYNLEMTTSYGNITRLSNSTVTYNPVYIFEKFENLPNDFSFLFSTLEPKQIIYYLSNNKYLVSLDVDMSTNKLGSLDVKYFGTDYNKNLMLFNMTSYYSGLTNLNLFLQPDTILSTHYNNSYSYYDDNGNLVDSEIINNKNVSKDDTYNVDNYLDVINNYINDLNDDMYNFSHLVQDSYDSIPENFQIIIFISFILGCIYLTFLFIRW